MAKSSNGNGERASRATMVGAVIAAFASSYCCLLPALLASVGLSGVGLAAAIEPYRWVLLGLTAGFLAVGFYLLYWRPVRVKTVEADANWETCDCETPRSRPGCPRSRALPRSGPPSSSDSGSLPRRAESSWPGGT